MLSDPQAHGGDAADAFDVVVPSFPVERFFNVQRWTLMPSGGHFGAMEEPELLVDDIRAFFRPLRSAVTLDEAHGMEVAR